MKAASLLFLCALIFVASSCFAQNGDVSRAAQQSFAYPSSHEAIAKQTISAYSPGAALGFGTEPSNMTVSTEPSTLQVGVEPANLYVGIEPASLHAGIEPATLHIGLEPSSLYLGIEPSFPLYLAITPPLVAAPH